MNERLFPELEELIKLDESGRKHFEDKSYRLAYIAYRQASAFAKRFGLIKMYVDYLIKAGDMAREEGGWLFLQEAAHCYALAGDRQRVDGLLKELKYREEDITSGSWMGMERTLADINNRRYQHGK